MSRVPRRAFHALPLLALTSALTLAACSSTPSHPSAKGATTTSEKAPGTKDKTPTSLPKSGSTTPTTKPVATTTTTTTTTSTTSPGGKDPCYYLSSAAASSLLGVKVTQTTAPLNSPKGAIECIYESTSPGQAPKIISVSLYNSIDLYTINQSAASFISQAQQEVGGAKKIPGVGTLAYSFGNGTAVIQLKTDIIDILGVSDGSITNADSLIPTLAAELAKNVHV